jgi:bifunctional UDP-N-acetylglucosamine pyrophosphorylase/glucosamine-1-phosphate N-acetyltransferase
VVTADHFPLQVVILAAGKGKRMASAVPKVLHQVAGKPMLSHVVDTSRALGAEQTLVVHGHDGERVKAVCSAADLQWVLQEPQLGTGHAVAQALRQCPAAAIILVLYGDVPLIRADSLQPLVTAATAGGLGLLTVTLADPSGYGRIVRDADGRVLRIVEEKDTSTRERRIGECNTGFLAAPAAKLRGWIASLNNDNAQGEYYLTDIVAMAVTAGEQVTAIPVSDESEVLGANDRIQLAALERAWQRRCARSLMLGGVSLADPARVDVRGQVETGMDCSIDVNVVLEGHVEIGSDVRIGPNCLIRDSVLEDGCVIHANSTIESSRVGPRCQVGPYARLRPGTRLLSDARVGNFVETKNSVLGRGTKVNHLSYVGDAQLGEGVNVGAGTITCNYDGANKHRTTIGDGAFIGSNAALVAPVSVGRGAMVGAGSTVSRDVPDQALVVVRGKARTIQGWKRPSKRK